MGDKGPRIGIAVPPPSNLRHERAFEGQRLSVIQPKGWNNPGGSTIPRLNPNAVVSIVDAPLYVAVTFGSPFLRPSVRMPQGWDSKLKA